MYVKEEEVRDSYRVSPFINVPLVKYNYFTLIHSGLDNLLYLSS